MFSMFGTTGISPRTELLIEFKEICKLVANLFFHAKKSRYSDCIAYRINIF